MQVTVQDTDSRPYLSTFTLYYPIPNSLQGLRREGTMLPIS